MIPATVGVRKMELRQVDSGNIVNFGEADATRHLRDHLECAQKLAGSHDLPVVRYLVEMAILALSYRTSPIEQRPKRE
jgi:hypothetical protein